MTLGRVSLIHSIILIAMGSWAYLSSETPSVTALIPVFIGAIILALSFKEGKYIDYVIFALTIIILLGLAMPLKAAIGRDDMMAMGRVGVMILATLWSAFYFIKVLFLKK